MLEVSRECWMVVDSVEESIVGAPVEKKEGGEEIGCSIGVGSMRLREDVPGISYESRVRVRVRFHKGYSTIHDLPYGSLEKTVK